MKILVSRPREKEANATTMVYESDFYTVRRPYSRPTLTSYTVTGCRPVITIRTVIPPAGLHSKVRMSVLLGELNRINHRPRPRVGCSPSEDFLCSRPLVAFDDETKLIRAQADRLLRYIYTRVPTRERTQPIGVLSAYERHSHYTPPEDRYSSPNYSTYHRDIPSNILNMSYYYEPSRVSIGRGHLACVSYAGGRGYPKRRHLYSDENRDIGDEIKFRSYYNKIMNPKRAAEALLLPTGFASRLLLTDRNVYEPRDESRALLFTTPIKKGSAASKEKRLKQEKDKEDLKAKKAYEKTLSEPIGMSVPFAEKEILPEYNVELLNKKPRKQSKEEFTIETVIKSKSLSKSPERVKEVECSATIVRKCSVKEPELAPIIEPELSEPEPIPEPEVPKTPKKTRKESKKKDEEIKVEEPIIEQPLPEKEIIEEPQTVEEPLNQVTSVEPEETPVVPEEIPIVPEEIPIVAEEIPIVPEEIPIVPDEIPIVPEDIPIVPEETVVQEEAPVVLEETPSVQEETPVVATENIDIPELTNQTSDEPTPIEDVPTLEESIPQEIKSDENLQQVEEPIESSTEPIQSDEISAVEESIDQKEDIATEAINDVTPVQDETETQVETQKIENDTPVIDEIKEIEPEANEVLEQSEPTGEEISQENLINTEDEVISENEPIIEEPQTPTDNIEEN